VHGVFKDNDDVGVEGSKGHIRSVFIIAYFLHLFKVLLNTLVNFTHNSFNLLCASIHVVEDQAPLPSYKCGPIFSCFFFYFVQ
jgi:hypothetical protein